MDIFNYFQERREQMDRGHLSYNRNVMASYNSNPERRMLAKANISAQGRAEKSDPFLTRRMMAHIESGAATVEDYYVEFVPGKLYTMFSPNELVDVLVPRNRKIA